MTLAFAMIRNIFSYFLFIDICGTILVLMASSCNVSVDGFLVAELLAFEVDAHYSENGVFGVYNCVYRA